MSLARRTGALACLISLGLAVTPALAGTSPSGPSAADPQRPTGSYDETRLLVAFDPGTPAESRRSAHAAEGARVENTIERLDLDVVKLRDGADPVEVATRYERNPNVLYTDFNHEFTVDSSDTLWTDQWGLNNTGQPVTGSFVTGRPDVDVDAPEGWATAFGATIPDTGGTTVGIIDTGIDLGHVDLVGKTDVCANATGAIGLVVSGSCSDDNLHGTHVAGTIGARTDNGVGVAGVAPDARFAVVKALNAAGSGFYSDIVAAIDYLSADRGVKIISMSIGGPQDDALDRVLTDAYARGTLLIAAAGNDYDDTKSWPAYHRDVMSVASINAAGAVSDFSTCNSDVEIIAPGEDIWSTFPGNGYGVISGTSMATPHVSGVAALLMSEKGLTAAQTRSALKSTAVGSISCRGFANVGLVNLANALAGGGGGGTTEPAPTGTGTVAGKVTSGSGKSAQALSGATVSCGTGGSATSGSDGRYTIASVPVGTYTCTASASGYRSKSVTLTVSKDTTTPADFSLR